MKARLIAILALLALGILGLTYQGSAHTTRDVVLDAGPRPVEANQEHTITIMPTVRGMAIAGGAALWVPGRSAKWS